MDSILTNKKFHYINFWNANMKYRIGYLETLLIAIFGFLLFLTGLLSLHDDLLNVIYPSNLWTISSGVLRTTTMIYGAAVAIAAACSFLTIKYQARTLFLTGFHWVRSFAQETRATWKWISTTAETKDAALWLVLITTVGAAVRCYFLAQPMRYDEAFTFLNFVNSDIIQMFYYALPNNHVLHTILVKVSAMALGSHPVSIRLPAFFAGICAIPMTFYLSRLLSGTTGAGFLSCGVVAVFPYLILYDTMARGYSLLVLLSLCMAALSYRLIEYPSTRLCSLIALLTALGLLDMPSFLFPTAGFFFWILIMLVERGRKPIWVFIHVVIPLLLMTAGLTGLFYTPVIIASNGLDMVVANRFVKSLSWSEFLTLLPGHITATANAFTRDIPLAIVFGGTALLFVGLYSLARKGRWNAVALLPALIVGGSAVLFAKRAIPYERNWIYLLPCAVILADAAYAAIPRASSTSARYTWLLFAGLSALLIMNQDIVATYPDTGHFPEAPEVVKILSHEMSPIDKVVAKTPADAPTRFYMWYQRVPHKKDPSGCGLPLASKKFFIVKPSIYSLSDLTKHNARRLLTIGDAELYVSEIESDTQVLRQSDPVDKQ